jgi:FkbM family methyltransferase
MKVFIEGPFKEIYEQYPLVLADIGAGGGIPRHWRDAQEHLTVIGFEPDKREYERLTKRGNGKRVYVNAALSNKLATSEFFVTRKQQASSMLEPNMDFLKEFPNAQRFDVTGRVTTPVDTLDHQTQLNQLKGIDFLKIDAQGTAYLILEGARQTLQGPVFGCEIEVEFVPLYKDQAQFAEIDQLLRRFDYQLFDLQTFRWKRQKGVNIGKGKGQLIFANALYLRRAVSFINLIRQSGDMGLKKAKLLKAISVCFVYGYFDYAYQLLEEGRDLFTTEESAVIEKRIKAGFVYQGPWDWLKHRLNLGALYFHVMNWIRREWTHSDHRIGNL